jgi:hypothetical protein
MHLLGAVLGLRGLGIKESQVNVRKKVEAFKLMVPKRKRRIIIKTQDPVSFNARTSFSQRK